MSITTTADFLVAQLPNINPPSARFGHTAVPVNNSIFIFGGGTGSLLNDLWQYDLNTQKWSQPNSNGGPLSDVKLFNWKSQKRARRARL